MAKKIFLFTVYYILFALCCSAQKDTYWKVGRGAGLDFKTGTAVMNTNDNCSSSVSITNTCISDNYNRVIFYSNACRVYDRLDQVMPNGSGFNQGTISNTYVNTDYYPQFKGATIIPFPNDTNKFYMFYENYEWSINGEYLPERLYYLVVDKSLHFGYGDVTIKDQIVIDNDTLTDGEVLAVKHGNGKDWWIICRKFKSDTYYKILVNSSGVQNPTIQHIGIAYTDIHGINGSCNSNLDGNKLVFSYGSWSAIGQIDVFDFDRCTGILSNNVEITLADAVDSIKTSLCCFSPNSRFMYASDVKNVWQFDLNSPNIYSSKVKLSNNPSGSYFMTLKIGADNKVYISPWGSSSSTSSYMHVINYPDSLGLACNFVQNALNFGGNGHWAEGGLPNVPNFSLGAVAPCGFGEDELMNNEQLNVYPNPANTELTIGKEQLSIKSIEVRNVLGQIVLMQPINNSTNQKINISVSNLSSGIYFLKATDEKGFQHTAKFVKE